MCVVCAYFRLCAEKYRWATNKHCRQNINALHGFVLFRSGMRQKLM